MIVPLLFILIHTFKICSQDQIEDYLKNQVKPEKVIYAIEDKNSIIYFNSPQNKGRGSIYINMKLDSKYIVSLARVDKSKTEIYVNPFTSIIKNLTTTFIEFKWIPVKFDDAELYILTKRQTANKKFRISVLQKYRIIVEPTTVIKCNCTPNYLYYYHTCQCEIYQKPQCEIVVISTSQITHNITTHSEKSSFDFRDLHANVTIYTKNQDVDVKICVKYNDTRRTLICHHYYALRFPRTFPDVIVNYLLLPIGIFFLIFGIFFALLRSLNLIGNNQTHEYVITRDSKNHKYGRHSKEENYPYFTDSEEILNLLASIFDEKENKKSNDSFFQSTKNESAIFYDNFTTKEIHVENPFKISAT